MTREFTPRQQLTLQDYYQGVLDCDIKVLPRALTLIESNSPEHQLEAEALLTKLLPHTGKAMRVGITGAPGVGKSTFIEAVGMPLCQQGQRVAVLAVDPSSEISGGSILGDKTRMTKLSNEPNAYIRPTPSAGTLGGVARKTRETMLVFEAASFDVVIVETVGVGQSETMVANMTDCFLALMMPGAGDELQGIKRGLLEVVDIIAVNKADGTNQQAADLAARQYRAAFQATISRQEPIPEVLTCSALHHRDVDKVWAAVTDRYQRLVDSGQLQERHRQQNVRWLWTLIKDRLLHAVEEHPQVVAIRNELEQSVLDGVLPPEVAARRILSAFGMQDVDPSPTE